jgi:hypothetical protein
MLASLRVLHVDPSHAQAVLAAIEERPSSMTYQLAHDVTNEVWYECEYDEWKAADIWVIIAAVE